MMSNEQAEGSTAIVIDSKSQMNNDDVIMVDEDDYALVTFSERIVGEDGKAFTRTGTRIRALDNSRADMVARHKAEAIEQAVKVMAERNAREVGQRAADREIEATKQQ